MIYYTPAHRRTLKLFKTPFDNTLDQAVKRLATGVEGLGSFVEDLEDLVQQKKN